MSNGQLPDEHDWMAVGNDFRKAFNRTRRVFGMPDVPLLTEPAGIPSDELLNAWEKELPGSKDRLINMAESEMKHRQSMNLKIRKRWSFF